MPLRIHTLSHTSTRTNTYHNKRIRTRRRKKSNEFFIYTYIEYDINVEAWHSVALQEPLIQNGFFCFSRFL